MQGPVPATLTVVAASSSLDGKLTGSAEIRLEGRLKGSVDSNGHLTVAEGGEAHAELHARSIIVSGRVRGNVSADEKIELAESADVQGDITAPRILIREGATFQGQVFMKSPGKRPESTAAGNSEGAGKDHAPPPSGETGTESRAASNDKPIKTDSAKKRS